MTPPRLIRVRPLAAFLLSLSLIALGGCTAVSRLVGDERPRRAATPVAVAPVTPASGRAQPVRPALRAAPLLLSQPAPRLKPEAPAAEAGPRPSAARTVELAEVPDASDTTSLPPAPPVIAAAGSLADGYVLPRGLFAPPPPAAPPPAAPVTDVPANPPAAGGPRPAPSPALAPEPPMSAAAPVPAARPAPVVPVALYVSPTSDAFFAAGGVDYRGLVRPWEDFLRRVPLPYDPLTTPAQLDAEPPGVLILPSAVALSAAERAAIIRYRERGGSVFVSWLAGVRSETGAWTGFDFMAQAFGVRVLGNNAPEGDADDTFFSVYGETPVTLRQPAGKRFFIGRSDGWQPLRLAGGQAAVQLTDWSRTVRPQRPGIAWVFDEHPVPGGSSRVVAAGVPERLWSTAPADLELMVGDAIAWLQRRPAAVRATWPEARQAALVAALDISEQLDDVRVRYLKALEERRVRATLFLLPEAARAAGGVADLLAAGHEVAYFGDVFEEFKGQNRGQQDERLRGMREGLQEAGADPARLGSFHAPMESIDALTVELLPRRGVRQLVDGPGSSETALPHLLPANGSLPPLLVLPRTQRMLDELPDDKGSRLRSNRAEFDLAADSGALAFAFLTASGGYPEADWRAFLDHAARRGDRLWWTTVGAVGEWWRARERVSVAFDAAEEPPLLTVRIAAGDALAQPVSALLTAPRAGATARLLPVAAGGKAPPVRVLDSWRLAVDLAGLPAGEHAWRVHFETPPQPPQPSGMAPFRPAAAQPPAAVSRSR